jgi:hypothetical protein
MYHHPEPPHSALWDCSSDIYDICNCFPDPPFVELFGTLEAALNNSVEVTFSLGGCAMGPGLVAVVQVLLRLQSQFRF